MITRHPDVPTSPVRAPRTSRRLVVILGVLLLLLGGGLLVQSVLQDDDPSPSASPASEAAVPSPPAVPAGGECTPWKGKPPGSVAEIGDPTWTTIGSVPAPSSPGVGPALTDPLRWCYAHTGPGALYAATNFIAQQGVTDPAVLASYLMADTPIRAVIRDAQMPTPRGAPVGGPLLRWRGYHVVTYTPEVATIDVAHQWGEHMMGAQYTLLWEQGDWKMVYPEALEFQQRVLPTPLDPNYWTPWGVVAG